MSVLPGPGLGHGCLNEHWQLHRAFELLLVSRTPATRVIIEEVVEKEEQDADYIGRG